MIVRRVHLENMFLAKRSAVNRESISRIVFSRCKVILNVANSVARNLCLGSSLVLLTASDNTRK